jgi:hypothetical protein
MIVVNTAKYAERHYAECHLCRVSHIESYAECRYAECHYAECQGAIFSA